MKCQLWPSRGWNEARRQADATSRATPGRLEFCIYRLLNVLRRAGFFIHAITPLGFGPLLKVRS
jgi:hypothetical protein